MLDHGDLFWLDLRPVTDQYILCKVINYGYKKPVIKNPYFIHVYNCFSNSVVSDIPSIQDRKLYLPPLSRRIAQPIGMPSFCHFISIESVNEVELVENMQMISSINREVLERDSNFGILDFDSQISTLTQEYPISDINHLETYNTFSMYGLNRRVQIEYMKERNLSPLLYKEDFDDWASLMFEWDLIKDAPLYKELIRFPRHFHIDWEKEKPKLKGRDFLISQEVMKIQVYNFFYNNYEELKRLGITADAFLMANIIFIKIRESNIVPIDSIIIDDINSRILSLKIEDLDILEKVKNLYLEEMINPNNKIDFDYYLNHPKIDEIKFIEESFSSRVNAIRTNLVQEFEFWGRICLSVNFKNEEIFTFYIDYENFAIDHNIRLTTENIKDINKALLKEIEKWKKTKSIQYYTSFDNEKRTSTFSFYTKYYCDKFRRYFFSIKEDLIAQ